MKPKGKEVKGNEFQILWEEKDNLKKAIGFSYLKWINIFARDFLLCALVAYMNWILEMKSWWVAFLTGALFVLVSWQFSEFLNERRTIT